MACIMKGYKAIFVMPDKMSKEKVDTMKAFGAEVVITPTNVDADDPRSYYSVARRIAEETPNAERAAMPNATIALEPKRFHVFIKASFFPGFSRGG